MIFNRIIRFSVPLTTKYVKTKALTGVVLGGCSFNYMNMNAVVKNKKLVYNPVTFSSSEDSSNGENDAEEREKLELIKNYIVEEVPDILNESLFTFPVDLFHQNVLIEYENNVGSVKSFSGKKYLTLLLMGSRIYFSAKSFAKLIRVLSVHIDPKENSVNANLRIILYPSPSTAEKELTVTDMFSVLEKRSEWVDFRLVVYLGKNGEISRLIISKIVPSDRTGLRASLRKLSTVLSNKKRGLPTPV